MFSIAPMPRPRTLKKAASPATEAFGMRLATLRKENNMTQTALSEKLGIVQTAISDYEVGRCYPSADILTKISGVFKVSTDELLGLQGEADNKSALQSVSGRILKRVQVLAKLPEHDQKSVLRMIDALAAATPKARRAAA